MRLAKRKSRYRLRAACLRDAPALSYKRAMAETTYFPRRLILAGAMISGILLALAVHMLGARYGLVDKAFPAAEIISSAALKPR